MKSEDETAAVMNVIPKSPGIVLLKVKNQRLTERVHCVPFSSTVILTNEKLATKINDVKTIQLLDINGINEDKQVGSSKVKIKTKGLKERETFTIMTKTIKGLRLYQQHV